MKILIDQPLPFALAHGGQQTQIEQTKMGLERLGVEVEYLRWWDDRQKGDIIHFFGAAANQYLNLARMAGVPVIMTQLFTETCNRSAARLKRQGMMVKTILATPFGRGIKDQLSWKAYRNCTHNVVGLEAERRVLEWVYGVSPARISIVPLGLSKNYLEAGAGSRSEGHLITTGTITKRKNSVTLAKMAHAAQTPILFVGKPYSQEDPYWHQFKQLIDDRFVKYHSHVATEPEMISLLQKARGFVFMSDFENWCLSAHEAVACGLPLLVQDQNWSRERFGDQVRYFDSIGISAKNVEILKQFYSDASALSAPKIHLHSWDDVSIRLKKVYEGVLNGKN